jgi:hypothetical protein
MVDQLRHVTATIAAQNTFSDALLVHPGEKVAVSLQPGAATTVTVQRRLDGSNWRDIADYTSDYEGTYEVDTGCEIRAGVKTGNYGASTTVFLRRP